MRQNQRLKHLHYQCVGQYVPWTRSYEYTCSYQLRTLDIHFHEPDPIYFGKLFHTIKDFLPDLQRLCLGTYDDERDLSTEFNIGSSCRFNHNLRELSLYGMNIMSMFKVITQVFVFSKLHRLTIWNCTGTENFLQDLRGAFLEKSMDLRHLAVSSNEILKHRNLYATLGDIFKSSHSLTSLHLCWLDLEPGILYFDGIQEPNPYDIVSTLMPLCRSLRSLSLHDSHAVNVEYIGEYDSPELNLLNRPSMNFLCSKFTNLQQFGISIPDNLHGGYGQKDLMNGIYKDLVS